MKMEKMKFGWRVNKRANGKNDPVSFFIWIPTLNDEWAYDLKITLKGLRQDGMRYKKFRKTIKAGGVEIEAIVVVVYNPPIDG